MFPLVVKLAVRRVSSAAFKKNITTSRIASAAFKKPEPNNSTDDNTAAGIQIGKNSDFTTKDAPSRSDSMRNKQCELTRQECVSLINAYASRGEFEKAKKVISDGMVPKEILTDMKYLLVGTLVVNGQVFDALKIYEEIKGDKCHISILSMHALFEHFLRQGQYSISLQLLEGIRDKPYWIDACSYILAHSVEEENVRATIDLFKLLNDKFISPREMAREFLFHQIFHHIDEKNPKSMFAVDLLSAMKEELGFLPPSICLYVFSDREIHRKIGKLYDE